VAFEGFPFNVGWELTLACNLRCRHCASAAGQARPNELTTEEALSVCDQFPPLLVQEVDLTGGEPLLRQDWFDIALHLKTLGISTNILTNGLAVTEETVMQMKTAGVVNVGVSLDGVEATHDRIRGRKGSFRNAMKTIGMTLERGIGVIVITTVNSLNINELAALHHALETAGVKSWRLQPIIPIGRVLDFRELEITPGDILQLGDFIRQSVADRRSDGLDILCSDGLEYIEGTENPDRPWRGCPGGWVTCGIMSDGKVKTCLSLPDDVIEGDLRKNTLWDIWFDSHSFTRTRQFSVDQLGIYCRDCDKGAICLGGCSSNSYAATRTFHNDPYCWYRLNRSSRLHCQAWR